MKPAGPPLPLEEERLVRHGAPAPLLGILPPMSATPSDSVSPASSAPDGPLIVQSDKSVLLEVAHPGAGEARRAIAAFAELERAPEHIHTYRITPLALWNARAAGLDAETVVPTPWAAAWACCWPIPPPQVRPSGRAMCAP